jgi:GNAT superfamily N-acetyltransferase
MELTEPLDDLADVWSVTCLFVHRTARRSGVAKLLLDGAVEHARRNSAGQRRALVRLALHP